MTETSLIVGLMLVLTPISALACSSCGCTFTSDWDAQGLTSEPGLRFDLRYDYLNQKQLRSGGDIVDRSAISLPTDREIEQKTRNNYVTLGVDYNPNQEWGINAQLPYIDRYHTTIAAGDTEVSSSHGKNIGDFRILARYQGFPTQNIFGLQFGLKLPTGGFHDTFHTGPQAGSALDRGLQMGTGTTDALAGLYYFGQLEGNWDFFIQGLAQIPLYSREEYKPGVSFNFNTGVHYVGFNGVVPHLQINMKTGGKDSGAQADRDNSGGTLVYVSPGATVTLATNLQAYGFVQLPLYQYVNGYQLTPSVTASIGLRYSL